MQRYALPFADVMLDDVPRVGGKNPWLAELIRESSPLGVRVPDGFALTAEAFRLHLPRAGIEEKIYGAQAALDVKETARAGRDNTTQRSPP